MPTLETTNSATTAQAGTQADFDSFQFLDGATRRVIKAWIDREERRPIPWTPLGKPLAESRIALISSAGVALKTQDPFDQEGERNNPWWGDPSFRVIPRSTSTEDVRVCHLHIDRSHGEADLDCVLPLRRLEEMADAGLIGEVAPSHYSFMGYLLDPGEFLQTSVPRIIRRLKEDEVDAVVLVPV